MINSELLTNDFEDIISEATETVTGKEIYGALNQAIKNQIAWHSKELKALQEFQWLVTGAAQGYPSGGK